MADTTIIAILILAGVFVITLATIFKEGHEAAIKMWGVMGALTGVAFGSITSYYFTKEKYNSEIAALKSQQSEAALALNTAAERAKYLDVQMSSIKAVLKGEVPLNGQSAVHNASLFIPEPQKSVLIEKLDENSKILQAIQTMQDATKIGGK